MAEALQVDLEAVGVEAHRHVELEAGRDDGAGCRDVGGGEGDDTGCVVDRVVGDGRLHHFGDGDEDGTGDGLGDVASPGVEVGAVGLGELEQRGEAVAEADVLVERGGRGFRRTGFPVQRKPCRRPRRSSKKAITACRSLSDFTP